MLKVYDPYSNKYLGQQWDYTRYWYPRVGQYYIGFVNDYSGKIYPVIDGKDVSPPRGTYWEYGPYQGWHILQSKS